MINHIQCPHCKNTFDIEDTITQKIETQLKTQYEDKAKSLEQREKDFEEKRKNANQWAEDERKKIIEITEKKYAQQLAEQEQKVIRDLQQQNDFKLQILEKNKQEQEQKNQHLLNQIVSLTTQLASLQQQLQNQDQQRQIEKQQLELQLTQQFNTLKEQEQRDFEQRTRQTIAQEETAKNELKTKELEKKLQDQEKLIGEMNRKIHQTSTQLQGEAQELIMEAFLKERFPFDVIEEIAKGTRGADILHHIKTPYGQTCGTIIYESKRTKDFKDEWIEKIRQEQAQTAANMAILVTQTMPKGITHFGQKNGVWICGIQEFKWTIEFMREAIIKEHQIRNIQANSIEKKQLLYDYLTSDEFRMRMENLLDAFKQMKEDLDKEKIALTKSWEKREKHLALVLKNTTHFYGAIEGIGGKEIPPISALDFPATND